MLYAVGCSPNRVIVYPDGKELPARPFVDQYGDGCWDCGVSDGNTHHNGCEIERCPRCRGQLIDCGCLDKALPYVKESQREKLYFLN